MSETVNPTASTAVTVSGGAAAAPGAMRPRVRRTSTPPAKTRRPGTTNGPADAMRLMSGSVRQVLRSTRARAETVEHVVADSNRVRHDGQRRVDGAAGDEEAAVDHVQVVDLVRFAVGVERR